MIATNLLSVEASAGSGKTFRLANRYIALLNIDNPINILAITFTNKAANEMKERIIKFLNELGNDKNVVEMICNEINISENELLRRKNLLIKKFLTNDINISTIDSFINKILRKFSYFAGIKSSFDVGDIDNNLIFREFLKELTSKDFRSLVSIAKKEEKFKNLLSLFEEFYEKDKELNEVLKNKQVKTKPDDSKAKKDFNRLKDYILNSSESSKSAIKAIDIDFYEIPYTTWFSKNSLKEYSYFKKKTLYQDWFDDVLNELKLFFKEYFRYQEQEFFNNLFYFYEKYKAKKWQIKKEENLIGFKDIEHLVYTLLREKIDKDFLYFRLDSKLNHILIDEFQDTSITQWEMFEPLVDEIASGIGRKENRSFFYVGDIKQAIYRFRGGKKELFKEVEKKYKTYGLVDEKLDTNYRSAKNIVEFVNQKFNLNENAHREEKGYVEVDEIDKDEAFNKVYEKIEYLNKNGIKDKDIAVLVYTNNDILSLANFLEEKGKKVVTAKKAKVISQKSPKAIISLMKYLNNNKLQIEKLNFLSLIGKKWNEEEIKIKKDKPIKMIKEIMDKYDLIDEASLKLLYHSKKYSTLEDFASNIDSFSEELPYKELDGVVVLTIHKSKGLEFDNVIVLDRLTKEQNDTSNILFYYENAKLKDIKLKISNRTLIDNEYKHIVDEEEKLKIEDKKNVEYVAFTRAKNSLIILKKDEKSAFITDLKKDKKGELIPSSDKDKKEIKPIKVTLKNYGKQEVKIDEEEYKPNDYQAIYLGNAIHYAFECDDIEAVRNRYADYCDINQVENLYKTAKNNLKKGQKEVPFIYDKKVGRIDLLIENEDNFEIIDYKSTKPNDTKGYFNQVRHYIEVVKTLTNKKAKGYLFYVDENKFEEVK